MYLAIGRAQKAQKELLEIEKTQKEILARGDATEMEGVVAKISALEKVFGATADRLSKLDDFIKEGLARNDLNKRQLPDLETLWDEQARAGMSVKSARELRSRFMK